MIQQNIEIQPAFKTTNCFQLLGAVIPRHYRGFTRVISVKSKNKSLYFAPLSTAR